MYNEISKRNGLLVSDLNPEGRETVFFIHGWPLSHKMFEYQWSALAAQGIRCVGVDLKGYGASDKPWTGYDYNAMSDDIHKIVMDLNLKDFTLLGYSMGGAIAAKYVSKYEKMGRVKKLILLAAACPCFTQRPDYPYGMTKQDVDALIDSLESDKPKTFGDFSKMVFDGDISSEFSDWFSGIAYDAALWSARSGLEALRDEDLRDDIQKINIPTAIFHGEKDRVCSFDFAAQMQSGIKNSFVLPFEKSGHGIFYEEKDKLNAAILDFVMAKKMPKPGVRTAAEEQMQDPFEQHYPFRNIPLPYGYKGLEPFIDEKTMHLHHDKHLQTYIDNLNKTLKDYPEYHSWTLDRLLYNATSLPENIRIPIARNAGGVYNHFFYFSELANPGTRPMDELATMINERFGSFEEFKTEFKENALSVFGSGYTWLGINENGSMVIANTKNQDTPLPFDIYPLLTIDVWEHAYYLKHYNVRAAYIDDWFKIINWDWVAMRRAKIS